MVQTTALCLAAALASASAFVAPSAFSGKALQATASKSVNTVKMAVVDDMLGADVETKGVFDPLGFAKNEENLFRYRVIELKHGRVAQLAVLGVIVQSFYHLPDPVFSNPRPLAALSQILAERPLAAIQIFLAVGLFELTIGRQDYETKAPGDIGIGSFFKPTDEAEWEKVQLRELKNGRLAMLAFMGELYQEYLTGQGPVEQIIEGHISPFGDGQGYF